MDEDMEGGYDRSAEYGKTRSSNDTSWYDTRSRGLGTGERKANHEIRDADRIKTGKE